MFPAAHGVVSQAPASAAPPGEQSPGILDEGNLSFSDFSDWQVGWEFKVGSTPITVVSGRVKLPNALSAPGVTLKLWRVSDQQLLAETPAFATASGAWVEQAFPAPIALDSNANYVISVHRGGINLGGTYRNTDATGTMTFADEIAFIQGRVVSGGGFPTTTVANRAHGLTDIVFL